MAKVLRTGEVAEILGLPTRTVTQLAKGKRLPTLERLGGEGYYRYPADQIMELKKRLSQSTEIGQQKVPPSATEPTLYNDLISKVKTGGRYTIKDGVRLPDSELDFRTAKVVAALRFLAHKEE